MNSRNHQFTNSPTGYSAFHGPRYRYLLRMVERYLPGRDTGAVLDVGLSPFTALLHDRLGEEIVTLDRRFYFDARFAHHRRDGGAGTPQPALGTLKNWVYAALPPFLQEGITLVLRKRPT